MMKKAIILLLLVLLVSQVASALKISTTPLRDDIFYVDKDTRYFYIYINNEKPEQNYVKIMMDPNSDYKFADSEFSFLYEQQLHAHQSIKVPIRINNLDADFVLSYKLEADGVEQFDSFIVMPEYLGIKNTAKTYTIILTMFAIATMMVLYIWNRFVYHSYKIDYQHHRHKKKYKRIHHDSSSAKLK